MPVLHIQHGKVALSYQDTGTATAVIVLVHGFPFSSDLWLPQIAALRDRYRVIAPDLRGFGRSEVTPGPYPMELFAADISELLDGLGIDEAVIGGLSMGGYVAFEFYRRHPDRVTAMVLADTRPDPDTPEARANREKMADLARASGSRAVTEQLLPKLLARATREHKPGVVSALREMMESAKPEAIEAALRGMPLRADSRPLLAELAVPVLIMNGAEDRITPAEETREWSLRIPRAQFEIIEDAGHVSNLEQPEAFNRVLLKFLARSVRPGADPGDE